MLRRYLQILPFPGLLLLALFLTSCVVYSVHPLYDERTAVFDASLLGRWDNPSEKNGSGSIIFTKGMGDFYKVTMIDPHSDDSSVRANYEAHAVRLNGRLFLDAVHESDDVAGHHVNAEGIASHMIVRVTVDGGKLSVDMLDEDWLKKGIESGKITLAHEMSEHSDDPIVLTASTSDLQRFVAAHANDDEAFPPSDPMVRAK